VSVLRVVATQIPEELLQQRSRFLFHDA
jgi:hypothetical protein